MRATRQTVQAADGKGSVGMLMRTFFSRGVSVRQGVEVGVRVSFFTMRMLMNVHAVLKRLPQTPKSNGDQGDTDKALSPRGQFMERQLMAQPEGQSSNGQHAERVASTPLKADSPTSSALLYGKRCNGCYMVRPGQDMYGSGD